MTNTVIQKIYISALILFAPLVFSCARSNHAPEILPPVVQAPAIDSTSTAYTEASNRHQQMAYGRAPASNQAWLSLIEEFRGIINADANGEWADDAQYAIGSCWLWLRQDAELPPIRRAIAAFQKLLQDFPESQYAAEAHYWLGHCYALLGEHNQAATHYQTVISKYLDRQIADEAQLQLSESYERQRHFTLAMTTYQALTERSKNPEIVAEAKERIAVLRSKEIQHTATKPSGSPPKPIKQVRELPKPQLSKKAPRILKTAPPPNKKVTVPLKPISNPSLIQQLGLDVKTIIIDPGHGGKDPGAVNRARQEKSVVLGISKMLRDLLEKKGYQVRMTRETDVYIPLESRAQFATKGQGDLFISIHANASHSAAASGIETYYLALASDESARITAARENAGANYSIQALDKLVADILKESKSSESRSLAEFIQEQLVVATGARNRGVKHAPFVVLIGTKVPSVLIEIGFLSNSTEGRKLVNKAYQRKIVRAIADGIERYVMNIPPATAYLNRNSND